MGKLDGKVAIVSGSGRGIGRAVALKLASEGARVVVNDLDEDPARETADAIVAAGGEATVCAGSVTAPEFGERFVRTALDQFGGLDIIVNNAGYTWDSVIQKMTRRTVRRRSWTCTSPRHSGSCAPRRSRSVDSARRRRRRDARCSARS